MDISIIAGRFYDYSLNIRGYSRATVKRYKYVIEAFAKFTGVRKISDISDSKVREVFYYGRTSRNWSANTYLIYYLTLKVFFRWCSQQGLLSSNPIDGIEIPKIEKKLPVRLTKSDAMRILDLVETCPNHNYFTRQRNYALFSMFIFAGLRKQEALNLKVADVDVENMTVFVRRGKGNKDRILPMSSMLVQSLKRYLEERKRLRRTTSYFFASSFKDMRYTDNGLKRLVKQISEASGTKFSVHKLRHTFATLMLEGGCDIYSLSKMMGHSDIKTTTIYLSATPEHLRSQMTKHPLNMMRF